MDVTIFTTECPVCKMLESKLDSKNIKYSKVTDTNVMLNLGISSVPMLKVNEEMMDTKKAMEFISNLK